MVVAVCCFQEVTILIAITKLIIKLNDNNKTTIIIIITFVVVVVVVVAVVVVVSCVGVNNADFRLL